jgi:hypothetical protein
MPLVGGLEHFLFFHIWGIMIPTDELIFFRGVGIPPTRMHYVSGKVGKSFANNGLIRGSNSGDFLRQEFGS